MAYYLANSDRVQESIERLPRGPWQPRRSSANAATRRGQCPAAHHAISARSTSIRLLPQIDERRAESRLSVACSDEHGLGDYQQLRTGRWRIGVRSAGTLKRLGAFEMPSGALIASESNRALRPRRLTRQRTSTLPERAGEWRPGCAAVTLSCSLMLDISTGADTLVLSELGALPGFFGQAGSAVDLI